VIFVRCDFMSGILWRKNAVANYPGILGTASFFPKRFSAYRVFFATHPEFHARNRIPTRAPFISFYHCIRNETNSKKLKKTSSTSKNKFYAQPQQRISNSSNAPNHGLIPGNQKRIQSNEITKDRTKLKKTSSNSKNKFYAQPQQRISNSSNPRNRGYATGDQKFNLRFPELMGQR